MESNPWKTLSSKEVYSNPWITVREDSVIRPDGKLGIYGVVECRRAVAIIALTEMSEIYLVGQFRYPMNEYSWELVEGGAERGEDLIACAARELREEAGVVANELIPLGGEVHLSNCHSSERGYFFLARGLTEVPAEPEGTEVLTIKKVPLHIAQQMVQRGEIKDCLTIIGLSRLEYFLATQGER